MTPGGFDEETTATRGRRRPELTTMLDAEGLGDDETEGQGDSSEYLLLEGDVIMAKITQATVTALGDAWVTYGAQTRVLPGESEESAFTRLASVTTARELELIGEHEQRVYDEVEARREEALNHRIPSHRG
jgi:hypothetical protein